jgi:hypothetical protein
VAAGCKSDDDCALDHGGGACKPGKREATSPLAEQGPLCRCDVKAGACVFKWHGPISCKTYKDCSWSLNPLRPESSKDVPRPKPKPIRPCVDGERDSECVGDGAAKTCRVVGWPC